ncbi:MAG: SDR family NAD(P)-dependent oxidoreductase [Oscillospiraceae bacterium]
MQYGNLTGKVAIVTGGGGSIGGAICTVLAEAGATVIAADVRAEFAQKKVDEITAAGLSAFPQVVDTCDKSSVESMISNTIEKFGKIDIFVACAGILDNSRFPDITPERWDRLIDINLRGTFFCLQSIAPHMMERKSGKIVTVSSQAGQLGGFLAGANYTASKGGIIAMSKAFARQCAPYNVNVNDVAPGLIATDMTADRNDSPASVPLARLGTSLDVAKAVYFLCSDLADYICGHTVDVNGGMLMRS